MPIVSEPGIAASADPASLGDTPVSVDGAVEPAPDARRGPGATTSPILAYLPPDDADGRAAAADPRRIRDAIGVATTLGFGPRFLHSTGQLHKGGPDTGVFLQLTADPSKDLPIPGWDESFGTLIAAQALGDLASLQQRGRRALRLHLGDLDAGLERLEAMVERRYRSDEHEEVAEPMQVAICGLGRMGAGMARRAARGGHDVVAWNRTESVAAEVAGEPENEGRIAVAEPIERLAELMAAPRHVVISVPSGDATDAMIEQLAGILEPGDVIIDAGNSRFHDSKRHAAELAEQGHRVARHGRLGRRLGPRRSASAPCSAASARCSIASSRW